MKISIKAKRQTKARYMLTINQNEIKITFHIIDMKGDFFYIIWCIIQ